MGVIYNPNPSAPNPAVDVIAARRPFNPFPVKKKIKNRTGTLKKGFSVVMDEVEPFDFFIEKK